MLLFMVFASFLLIAWHVWVYGPTGQAVSPGLSQKPFPLVLGHEIRDMFFSEHGLLAELKDILPYFMIGILLAGFIRTYKLAIRLRRTLDRYGFLSIFLASLTGILTPLCACGTLTTAVSLLFAGLPLAPVMALLVTSPLMSPTTYLITLSDLGPEWTVIRTLAALLMGIFAGVLTHLVRNRGFQTETIFIEGAVPRGDFHDENYPDDRLRCNCREKFGNRVAAKTGNMFLIFLAKSSEMLWLVGKYVLIGVASGLIVQRYMPYEWIYRFFNQENKFGIIWVTMGSVPIFLHQISASSILYHIKSALDGTMNGGAGLAFLIGGPVTAMPTMVMFWTIFRKRVFFLYMIICIVGTIVIAWSFQNLVFAPYTDTGNPVLRGVRSVSGGSSAIITKAHDDRHVKIVMDPGGKGTIATYDNSVEGHGGIVFDSGPGRFLADKYDNRRYIRNIAARLEENSGPEGMMDILIYNTAGNSGAFSQGALDGLEKEDGFKVKVTDRKETPVLSRELLAQYSQLWILFGEGGAGGLFSDVELETISGFSHNGKGLLIAAGRQRTGANSLSSRFGVTFSGSVEHADELPVSAAFYFFNRTSEILENYYRMIK
ncbi:MAG: permease [Nitrospirae bacterium]|nr:permease [Nitrospirota bacterium]